LVLLQSSRVGVIYPYGSLNICALGLREEEGNPAAVTKSARSISESIQEAARRQKL